jgi:hypothetical protein
VIFYPVRTKAMTKILSYWRFLSCLFLYTFFFFINFDNWLIFSCSSSKTVLLHFQMCCYDFSFGFIINSIPTAGSMLTANPFVDPSTYYNVSHFIKWLKKYNFLIGQNHTSAFISWNILITAQSCMRARQLVYHSCQVPKYRSGKSWWRLL